MERIEDERLLFFIEHAAQIRQWAALEGEVHDLTDRFLRGMVTRWEQQGPAIDGARHDVSLNDTWPRYDLYKPTWVQDDKPVVAVTLEWNGKRVGLDADAAPAVGVRIDAGADAAADLRQPLLNALATHRRATGGESGKFWLALRRVPPAPDRPGDLAAFEVRLLAELREEWHATATHIDQALPPR